MKKFLIPIGIVVVIVIVAIVMIVGRLRGPEVAPPAGQPTVTPGEETGPAGAYEEECEVGAWWKHAGVTYKTTGTETHTLGGKSMKLCCSVAESDKEGWKICQREGSNYQIIWMKTLETGGFVKHMEGWQEEGKSCMKMFDAQGNVVAEGCQ